MVKVRRTAVISGGQLQEGMGFAQSICEIVKKNFGIDLSLSIQMGGQPSRICWESTYEDLGEYQKLMGQVMTNQEYLAKIKEAKDLFIPGSVQDSIWLQM